MVNVRGGAEPTGDLVGFMEADVSALGAFDAADMETIGTVALDAALAVGKAADGGAGEQAVSAIATTAARAEPASTSRRG